MHQILSNCYIDLSDFSSAAPTLVAVATATATSSGQNLPQIVTHILQKAFFRHALVLSKMTEIVSKTTSNNHFRQKCCYYRHFFTSYPEMNEVLNRFAAEADANEIWISAEVQELRENRSGNQLCQIVGMALDTAKRNCIETTPPRGRYIRIRCRDMQEQTLIKIQYSCEDRMLREFDKAIVKMRDLIESVGGYLKLQLDGDTGSIKIAIPDN